MPFGTGRLCNCNNDFCLKSSLCDYNPILNPYESSSGIDDNLRHIKSPYSMKEKFNNIKLNKNNSNIVLFLLLISGIIILSVYKNNL
jgi:hypothetical protein